MHARVTTLHSNVRKLDDGVRLFQDQVIPAARQQRGFKGARLLLERTSGTVQAITLWDSAETAQAAAAALDQQRAQAAQTLGATNPTTEVFEIAVLVDA
jgi:heme-degrading monooxygenase HmoA